MPILFLLILFTTVPLLELYVIIKISDAIGVFTTITLLVLSSVLGTALLRNQGRAAWRRFTEAFQSGRLPHREAVDGVLVTVGGTLLLTPGFITDIVGLVLLVPPSRLVIRTIILHKFMIQRVEPKR